MTDMTMELRRALEGVARRFRHVRLWSALALCWLAWAIVGTVMWAIESGSGEKLVPDGWLFVLLGLVSVTGVSCAIASLRSVKDVRWVARRIERKHPELNTGLLAAVEEAALTPSGPLGFLQFTVIRHALEHRRAHDWDETVPTWKLRGTQLVHAAALGFLVAVAFALVGQARSHAGPRTAFESAVSAADVEVEPGNTEIERGTSLLVVARFKEGVPADATLVVDDKSHPAAARGMTRSLEDPTFAGHVESVDTDLSYRVEFAGKSTPSFQVRVFEYPELQSTDAKLVFPGYTSMAPKTALDIRHVTAVEGTELTLVCRLNKEVATAKLVDAEGKAIELTKVEGDKPVYQATMTLADPRRFRVALVDREGRSNKLATEIVANVTRNRPPVVKLSQPAHDVRVSPLEELKLRAEMEDDFGLVRHGLSYSMAGQEPREIILNGPAANTRKLRAEHMLEFESFHAAPDQLVTYFFWAEDIGPDGQPRRESSDMFFAEVRPFEEIFRQGEQPPGGSAANEDQEGQGDNARASDQLAELQKEIINGTWKLVRRETGAAPSPKLSEDGKVLQDSQHTAIEQAAQLGGRLRDAASKSNLEQATRLMKDAEKNLTDVAQKPSVTALRPALAAEQAAYQALLKLRAREFEVIRNSRQRSPSSRSASNRNSQRQLQELELKDDENRYEDQRTAKAQQEKLSQREQEQRETRQVLNRLRELAQRQNDVNDRLKELQSALEAAKTQAAREEVERQLKRLRDQQQQILRDTDELRERMEREENRDRMADARQELDQGREHVRQASEALEKERVSQALTEGARVGRQFNDLREELRKGASNRFAEEMTEMRQQAQRLDEDQKKLAEKLEAASNERQNSLRDGGERKQVREGLDQQQKRLDQILDQMKRTVQDAEETEPLLAKGLYDTARKADENKIADAIKASGQLVDLGIPEDAAKASRHAAQGTEQLREGVERSAQSVLGDQIAALKRAQAEVDDLADQVDRELAQATGQETPRRGRNGQQAPGQTPKAQEDAAVDPFDQIEMIGVGKEQPGDQPQQKQQRQNGAGRSATAKSKGLRAPQQQPRGQRGEQGQQGDQGQQAQAQEKGEPGEQPGQGQRGQQGEQQQGQDGNQQQQGQQGQQGQGGQPQVGQGQGQQQGRQASSLQGGGAERRSGADQQVGGARGGPGGPITGEGFRQWSDRMRDVEELLDEPELRAEAARIRDRVRGAREEYKRHSKVPDWNQLKTLVAEPINELRDRIAEEVRRRESPDALVPIDRDPVPPQFAEGVRRYYERLGSGR
jgi:hypothetical protein